MFKLTQVAVIFYSTAAMSPLVYAASLDDAAARSVVGTVSAPSVLSEVNEHEVEHALPAPSAFVARAAAVVLPAATPAAVPEVGAHGCLPGMRRMFGVFRTALRVVEPLAVAILRAVGRAQNNDDLGRVADLVDDITRRADPVLDQASRVENVAGLVDVAVAGAATGLAITGERTGDPHLSTIGSVVAQTGGALEEGVRRVEAQVASGASRDAIAGGVVATAAIMTVDALTGAATITGDASVGAVAHEVADISRMVGVATGAPSSAAGTPA
jgi:hypothetical protein